MSKANLIHIRGFVQLLTCLAIRLSFCGKRTLYSQWVCVGFYFACLMCVHQSIPFLIGWMAPKTSLLCIDQGAAIAANLGELTSRS